MEKPEVIGIVRRIDDLGRIVIPKELRMSLGIKEGDPLEIVAYNDGSFTFKTISPERRGVILWAWIKLADLHC